jgi:hypothetical protein
MTDETRDDVIKNLDNVEVTELDDKDLEDVAGGVNLANSAVDAGSNENCGCGGRDFTGGSANTNCGC